MKQTTADSNPKTEREKIVIYRNAYVLLRKRIKSEGVLTEEDKYFNDLQSLNAHADYPVVISISSSPRGSKGWTHNEVGEYMTLTEKGLRIQDIEALIKLKHEVDEIQLPDTPSVMISPALIKLKKAVDKIRFPIKPSVPGDPPVVKPPVPGNPTVDRP